MSSPGARDHHEQVAQLIRRLRETDRELSALTDGQVDAVLDPSTAIPRF